jgi:choline kinase
MSRFVRKIKNKNFPQLQIVILAAGVGSRTRSYEPRCLLKYNKKTILDNQIEVLTSLFNKAEISIVGGFDINKIIRKVGKTVRVIENQMYENTNSGESLRLGINNSMLDNILFLHGDLIISPEIFDNVKMDQSFLLVDSGNQFEEKEVGITIVDGVATVLSYSLPTKWCQIAYLAENELCILKKLMMKNDFPSKTFLTFEVINKIIENNGKFNCFDIGKGFIKEIDSLKDIN